MKSFSCICILLALICVGFASTSPADHSLVRHRRDLEFFQNTGISTALGNYGKLVQELINNLNKAADQAKDAVSQFNTGLAEQAKQCRERFMQSLKNLQDKVTDSIDKLQDKLTGSSSAIEECISSHRGDAQAIYKDASQQMSGCIDARLQEGEDLVKELNALSDKGQEIATQAFVEMRNCSEQYSGNIFAVGSCIGSVALKTEMKGASFLMQSGLSTGRLNLYKVTLPASLEACAGSSLVNAGIGTGKVLMNIGSCSTNAVINTFVGGSSSASDTPVTDTASSGAASISTDAGSASAAVSTASTTNAIKAALPSLPLF